MLKAKLFLNGKSQAVRLPKECRMKGREVYVKKLDDVIVLFPKKNPWASLSASLGKFSSDYMERRRQPRFQRRSAPFE